jgi:hypothetical protein
MHRNYRERFAMRLLSLFCLTTVALLGVSPQAIAQRAPAIPGVTGTIVTPETAKDEKKAEDIAAVAIKDAVTREDKGPLSDLKPGSTVVIRHGTDVTEGTVTDIQRSTNVITVRFANKKIEKLVLADKESPEARIVEYTDDARNKVTRYFRQKS